MWVIAGLGNPGRAYAKTRHNIGFAVVEEIGLRFGIKFDENELCRTGIGSMGDKKVILIEPLTFMNRSGIAIRDALRKYNALNENLIVVHDDIDMETGKIKLRKRGSSGGHRGVESIIQAFNTKDFIRVKIGIGRDREMTVEDYVLHKFRKEDVPLIRDAVKRAADAVMEIVTAGMEKAMNRFN